MRFQVLMTVLLCLVAAFANGQATREFNWIPSGNLDIGNIESENESDYRGTGEIIQTSLAYSDGMRAGGNLGRRTRTETFTVNIGRYRGGPCPGDLVIRRCIDTGTEPVELTIDRPFLFLIRDIEAGAVLFVGRVLDPSWWPIAPPDLGTRSTCCNAALVLLEIIGKTW